VDPQVSLAQVLAAVAPEHRDNVRHSTDAAGAVAGAHALVVVTDWDAFADLDMPAVRAARRPRCAGAEGRARALDRKAVPTEAQKRPRARGPEAWRGAARGRQAYAAMEKPAFLFDSRGSPPRPPRPPRCGPADSAAARQERPGTAGQLTCHVARCEAALKGAPVRRVFDVAAMTAIGFDVYSMGKPRR